MTGGVARIRPAADASGRPLTYTPHASEHDLIYGCAYAYLLMGHGADPWLVRPLSAWMEVAEKELKYRRLFKKAKRVCGILLEQRGRADQTRRK
jgi:hypothetical protein